MSSLGGEPATTIEEQSDDAETISDREKTELAGTMEIAIADLRVLVGPRVDVITICTVDVRCGTRVE